MRITLLFIITIFWDRNGIQAQQCEKPEVTRVPVYIYRRTDEFTVKVNRCLFNDTKHAYSDITENCMKAFKTSIFKDKWKHDNKLRDRGSPVVLEEYITTADRIKNKIKLRSGFVCRYDRGFCYDPSETVNYAVVWNVVHKPLQACPTRLELVRLELVFSGYVDIWKIKLLKYLVYYHDNSDMAFYLKIVQEHNCDNNNIMITEENKFIISQQKLNSYSHSTTSLNNFPLVSKRKISEAIMQSCDLQQYPLDFTNRIGQDYLKESKNIKIILEYYQELITGVKIDMKKYINKISIGENSKPWNAIARNLTNLESLLNIKFNDINEISSKLKNLQQLVGDMNIFEGLNKTTIIIQELQQEDSRLIEKIDNEHDALKKLEQNSIYPTRIEVDTELSKIQKDINSKLQVFINKMDLTLKENFTNLENTDSKFQRDIADRYDRLLKRLESNFENLSELLENVRNQSYPKINVINESISINFNFIKNKLAKIEHDIPEIQSLLSKWHNTDNNFVNLDKDFQNHKNNFSNIVKLGEKYLRNIQTNISNIHLISLNNKYNISEMKNRFETLLKKISDVDWNIVKVLKPDSISEEEFQNELTKFQRQYDKKLEILGNNLNLALEQYKTVWSLQYSNSKNEILDNVVSLLDETTHNNSENTNELIESLKKRVDSEFTDIKQTAFNEFSIFKIDLNDLKFNISNITKLILERLNGTKSDILNMKTELSKCKLDYIGTVRFGEDKLRDIQQNTTNINDIVLNFGKDISEIEKQTTEIKKELFDVERELNEKTNVYIDGSKKVFEDIVNRIDIQSTTIKQLTFRNLSLIESELDSIQQDLLINHKPILARVEAIDIAVEKLKHQFKKYENNTTLNFGNSRNEVKNIRDIVIETKKRSMNNEGRISELKFDLDTITTKLKGIQEVNPEYTLKFETLNESLKLQKKDISNIFPQLVHFRGVIDKIKSNEMDIEDKIHNFEEAIEQIDKKFLKNIEGSDKISRHNIDIDDLKNQVKILGTNMMNADEENENDFGVIKKNMSDIFIILKNKETDTSGLKTRIQDLFTKFDENKKLIEESKGDCLNYVNSRMRSVTEEITEIHSLILKNGEGIRKVQAQMNEKSSDCCEETRKDLSDKDALIKQLTVNLDKVMKQARDNDERLTKITKLIEDNVGPDPSIA